MAERIVHAPGTELGPCATPCTHVECYARRVLAEATCRFCKAGIGYDTPFFYDRTESHPVHAYAHSRCAREAKPDRKHQIRQLTREAREVVAPLNPARMPPTVPSATPAILT